MENFYMTKKQPIYNLFEEYETDTLSVSQFGIVVRGTCVDYLHLNKQGEIEIWAGNPDNDKYAEELLLTKSERDYIFDEVDTLM